MGVALARRSSPMWLVAVASLSPGCRNDLDALYCDPECRQPDAGEPAVGSEPPILPRSVDPDAVSKCEACFEQHCGATRDSCLEDAVCTAQLRCFGECADPGCLEICRGGTAADGYSPFFEDMTRCLSEQCPAQCQLRRNWACLGNYVHPSSEGQSIDVYFRFGDRGFNTGNDRTILPLAGTHARVCDGLGCRDPVPLDVAGGALLRLPTGNTFGYFVGYIELEGDDVGLVGTHYRIYPGPLSQSGRVDVGIVTDLYAVSELGWLPSDDLAALWVLIGDCTLFGASSVRVQLRGREQETVAYGTPTSLSVKATSTSFGTAFFPALSVVGETERVVVEVFLLSEPEAELVSWTEIDIRPGWTTHVLLPPSPEGLSR